MKNLFEYVKEEIKSALTEEAKKIRKIFNPKRGNDKLFVQPKEHGLERERFEEHNRERFANHFNYADQFVGNKKTFDRQGDYNCGRCNQADGNECLLVKVKINRKAGSCEDWENISSSDSEMVLKEKSPELANYGVAKNGEGFGCHRCPFSSKAYNQDSKGRDLYCGKGDFRVFGNSCCSINGAELIKS